MTGTDPRPDHVRRDDCRLCGSGQLQLVVPLTPTPIADAYVTRAELDMVQKSYPIDLWFCDSCSHVQLRDVVRPDLLFRPEYTFLTGSSASNVTHFREYTQSVLSREKPAPGALAVDVGSNDGTFLRFFQEAGLRVLGVDPATEVARRATEAGIETWPAFFGREAARRIRSERGPARLVTANNVFAHADDLAGMADAVRDVLAPDGAFVFEVSYVVDVVERMLLGTIFHEHLCYHAVRPMRAFLRRHGLELVNVERNSAQGGSIIGTAQPIGGPRTVASAVEDVDRMEVDRGMDRAETYRAFSRRIESLRSEIGSVLDRIASEKKTLAGFGAARGGTTMLCHFGLGRRLAFIVDDSPAKQGLYSPGDHVPVLPSQALYERKPDYVFILAWVHAQAILARHRAYCDQGGKFITVGEGVEVVGAIGVHKH